MRVGDDTSCQQSIAGIWRGRPDPYDALESTSEGWRVERVSDDSFAATTSLSRWSRLASIEGLGRTARVLGRSLIDGLG